MPTQNFSTSQFSHTLLGARTRRPTVALLGESHGRWPMQTVIQRACYAHYHADILLDERSYASGGMCYATDGTTTSHLLATQIPQFQARPADIAVITSGYNDGPTTHAVALTTVSNILTAADACLAAGAKVVILTGQTPQNNTTSGAVSMAMNTMLWNASRLSDRLEFLPITDILVDRTLASPNWDYAGTPGVKGSMGCDNTHWSGEAVRQIAPRMADILRRWCPERYPQFSYNTGAYQPANAPYGNMLGDSGNIMGTAGLNDSSFDTGVAGINSSGRISISKQSGITYTNSIVTGSKGQRKQQIAVSGTSAGVILPTWTTVVANANNGDATRRVTHEALVDLIGVTNLNACYMTGTLDYFSAIGNGAATWPDNTTESLFMYSMRDYDAAPASNPSLQLVFSFGANPSGTIQISQVGMGLIN